VGLIAPLFLAGALVIALPFWLHRLQTKSSNRQPFSSAMLLETTEQQVHVRKKLKYLLLLALRALLLLLLVLAFAKPFIERSPDAVGETGAGSAIVILDTSASMGRSGVFDQALEQARDAIDTAPAGAALLLATADGRVRILQAASTDRSAQRAALNSVRAGAERLDFGRLMSEVERLAEALPAPITLHLVSDFQQSGMPAQFADVIPAGIATLVPRPVGTGEPVNWSIEQVRRSAQGFDVSVLNQGLPDRTVDVQLRINGELAGSQSASGQGRFLLSFDSIDFPEGEHRIDVQLATDDDLAIDNHWHGVVSIEPPLAVPLLTDNPGGLPVTYLSAALESLSDARFEVIPTRFAEFDARVLARYRWLIVDDIGAVDSLLADALDDFVRGGGKLLAFAADRALGQETLPVSGHRLAAASLGTGRETFLAIGQFDGQHPVLSGTEGWHRVKVSRSVAIDEQDGDEVLMRLADGEPFLIEQRRDSGSLLLMLSAVDNRWNDLPVHPVFVGFMIETARYLSGRVDDSTAFTAGDSLPLTVAGSAAGQVVDPEGNSVLSLADTALAQVIRLDKPGIYEVYTANGQNLIAVNIDPLESQLARVSEEVLERWQDVTYSSESPSTSSALSAGPEPLALWPWLLLMLVVFAIAESALANVQLTMRTGTSA
jgi:hypothetical protein